MTPDAGIPQAERDDRETIAAWQARRFQQLLAAIAGRNPFYTRKLEEAGVRSRRAGRGVFPTISRGCR